MKPKTPTSDEDLDILSRRSFLVSSAKFGAFAVSAMTLLLNSQNAKAHDYDDDYDHDDYDHDDYDDDDDLVNRPSTE